MPRGVRANKANTEQAPAKAVVVKRRPKPTLTYEPEIVMVKALRRGYYGLQVVVDKKWKDDQNRIHVEQEIGRDAVIRNEDEVFEMDTADMRKWPLGKGEHPHGSLEDTETITTESGTYELPSWVTYVNEKYETEAVGHQKTFGNLGELTGGNVI
jgi:hypothetical protein